MSVHIAPGLGCKRSAELTRRESIEPFGGWLPGWHSRQDQAQNRAATREQTAIHVPALSCPAMTSDESVRRCRLPDIAAAWFAMRWTSGRSDVSMCGIFGYVGEGN